MANKAALYSIAALVALGSLATNRSLSSDVSENSSKGVEEADGAASAKPKGPVAETNQDGGTEIGHVTQGNDSDEEQTADKSRSTIDASSVDLTFGGISPTPASDARCEGEMWSRVSGENDTPLLVWNSGYSSKIETTIYFEYRYDGRRLFLFNGLESRGIDDPTRHKVHDRTLTLVHLSNGDWLLNGQRMIECAG